MKTKVIVTAVLLFTVYVVLVNLMYLSDFAQDKVVKVGWYSEFGGSCVIGFILCMCGLNFLMLLASISLLRFSSPK